MIHQRSSYAHIVVKRNHLGQDGGIAGLSYISTGTCNEPQRIIIEATADIGVAFLGQRLGTDGKHCRPGTGWKRYQ